ncbi:MAG: low molecular weight phosphotyrosine protein phosphatase, partial [Phaeobacter italicus]
RPDIETDSAGTSGYNAGEPPYAPMQEAGRKRGIEMGDLRARKFLAQDFSRFDLILAMDAKNLARIEALRPDGEMTPVRLFAGEGLDACEVPDPYYTRDFEGALDLIETAAQRLADTLD